MICTYESIHVKVPSTEEAWMMRKGGSCIHGETHSKQRAQLVQRRCGRKEFACTRSNKGLIRLKYREQEQE